MTQQELYQALKSLGMPVAYSHFVETADNSVPNPPYITYLATYSSDFQADNKNYQKVRNFQVELYTTKKDLIAEKSLEDLLDKSELPYTLSETYLDTESMFQRIYEIQLI
ncbi:hypothetical protein [Paenibacillus wenxiniae]|uniref:Prophage pi2 protein 38 n=1 Tax=Paenibacillus wenxiniae TaxID=1636843 RepID=A0ABW4RH03_9BACL